MAQKVSIELVDDLDGSSAEETVTFGLDGTTYEIDLNTKNAAKLRKAMDAYVGGARRVSRAPRKRGKGSDAARIREWAQQNGLEVSDKGAIPAHVREAYAAANN